MQLFADQCRIGQGGCNDAITPLKTQRDKSGRHIHGIEPVAHQRRQNDPRCGTADIFRREIGNVDKGKPIQFRNDTALGLPAFKIADDQHLPDCFSHVLGKKIIQVALGSHAQYII